MISPVVVVPGITAADLDDEYTAPPEAVWTTVRKRSHERILFPVDQISGHDQRFTNGVE